MPDATDTVIAKLEPLLLPRRIARMRAVLAARSDHVAFVFERMTDPHNLSAALRSLDAFGFQDAHWIAPAAELGLSHLITRGTERWLTLTEHDDTAACFAALRARGYHILASEVPALSDASRRAPGAEPAGGSRQAPGAEPAGGSRQAPASELSGGSRQALASHASLPLDSLDLRQRTAFVFGNEHAGVTPETLALADGRFQIAMTGFAESLNLSVACAITAYHARRELRRLATVTGDPAAYGLPEARKRALYADWLRQSVRSADKVLEA
jgi:tRNA (guanosine-2'-O-)-methyltransferase